MFPGLLLYTKINRMTLLEEVQVDGRNRCGCSDCNGDCCRNHNVEIP
nr:MAG TPA: Protein of unknown function (DUF3109) [Caudoviricetes sp.]